VNWYLAGSTYSIEPYADQPPALIARSPWSGHYVVKPIIWAYAHYGQFTRIGWRYIASGCKPLSDGGTVVTLASDDGNYSVIVETAGATTPQEVKFRLSGGLLSRKPLNVWRTTRDSLFARQKDVVLADDGSFTVTFEPDAIYSLSTIAGQQKGKFSDIPRDQPFPFPYVDAFDRSGMALLNTSDPRTPAVRQHVIFDD
jgi:galactosylceramidase